MINDTDEMQDSFLKCETEKDLRKTIKPYVIKILDRYRDSCYGTITSTADSLKNELYDLECFVYRNSRFSICTIEETVDAILKKRGTAK